MNIVQAFKKRVEKYMAEADKRADAKLAKARTKLERDKIRHELEREKMRIKTEAARAKTALLEAEAAKKRAQKQLREAGNGSGFFNTLAKALGSYSQPAPRKRTGKCRRAKRRPVRAY